MFSFRLPFSKSARGTVHASVVALIWLLGLVFGCMLAGILLPDVAYLFLAACSVDASIIGLAITLLFPFLIVLLCYLLSSPILALPFIFLKAVQFSLCCAGVTSIFNSAGWLIRFFLLFSDHVSMIVLVLLSLRHCGSNAGSSLKRESLYFVLILLFAGFIDYLYISPFLTDLMLQL